MSVYTLNDDFSMGRNNFDMGQKDLLAGSEFDPGVTEGKFIQ